MDTYTTALFLKTQTKTRNGFEQRELEPKGYGGTRSLNASVLQTTKNKNHVFMAVYVVYNSIYMSIYTTGIIYYILGVATAPAVAHAIKSCVIPLDLEICHTHSPCVHVI